MTGPKETNDEINEELSTDELKGVNGGIMLPGEGTNLKGNGPEGSGSVMSLKDWKKSRQGIGPNPWDPIGIGPDPGQCCLNNLRQSK
ncbi:hypothetical protein PMIT1323_00867 [Prochlorococcus marinus str. MIT 1323]|nr:hypothetical protein PMIT1323_00867 [Prochlorococcus marinus str. MIT 1323]